jgi:hypothetical protein
LITAADATNVAVEAAAPNVVVELTYLRMKGREFQIVGAY